MTLKAEKRARREREAAAANPEADLKSRQGWIPVRLVDPPPRTPEGWVATSQLAVGDAWFMDRERVEEQRAWISDDYFKHNAGRLPLYVMLPGRNVFLIDGCCFESKRGAYGGWAVKGTPPRVTVSPSINIVGRYHGWLTDGWISPDVDGRKL